MSHESEPSESLSAAESPPYPGPTFYEQLRAVDLWSNPFLDDRRHDREAIS